MTLSQDQIEDSIQKALGYHFKNIQLLREALTHRSAVSGRRQKGGRKRSAALPKGSGSNERLEFVGDRVLGLLMAEWLFQHFPQEQEGALGPRHAHLVSRPILAEIADQIGLSAFINIASHEEAAGIRQLSSIQADAMEAVLGALYLDGGLEPPKYVVHKYWGEKIDSQLRPHKEPKTLLQEYLLSLGRPLPHYELISAEGPSHAPVFRIEVKAQGLTGKGEAGSKRLAESAAALDLLKLLGQNVAP
ncbi:ribonuclease III [Swingsia samuiensis]|uniref:Ribonuclease 3 n=1 Tax=Swingsia samuiensis TaxID=1293412 RepID=A0A4Y6UL47_9PROT|nr:ribonuclease III [Swingsia samuiensis]QDH17520.1 ribonuclease III [Swingsia samuiensis]